MNDSRIFWTRFFHKNGFVSTSVNDCQIGLKYCLLPNSIHDQVVAKSEAETRLPWGLSYPRKPRVNDNIHVLKFLTVTCQPCSSSCTIEDIEFVTSGRRIRCQVREIQDDPRPRQQKLASREGRRSQKLQAERDVRMHGSFPKLPSPAPSKPFLASAFVRPSGGLIIYPEHKAARGRKRKIPVASWVSA